MTLLLMALLLDVFDDGSGHGACDRFAVCSGAPVALFQPSRAVDH
ncbi:hypothetical protein ACW69C_20495 [Streptomyces sp. MN3]